MIEKEKPIWQATPSQMVNLNMYVIYILTIWLVFPGFLYLWKYLTIKNTRYELTDQRLTLETGILNKKKNELELYRVRDYRLERPLFLRMFGLSNLVLDTSDRSDPKFYILAVKDGESLAATIRDLVEKCRVTKGVREIDYT